MKGRAIADRDFTASFRLAPAAKDADLVDEPARRHGLDLPLFGPVARRLRHGATEDPGEDFSATYLTSAPTNAGLAEPDLVT